jgi:hypothetical protein
VATAVLVESVGLDISDVRDELLNAARAASTDVERRISRGDSLIGAIEAPDWFADFRRTFPVLFITGPRH